MKKLYLIIILVIIAIMGVLTQGAHYAFAESDEAFSATIKKIKGTIEIKKPGQDWEKAQKDTKLEIEDLILASDDSKATIEIVNINDKKNIVSLDIKGKTEISIKDILLNSLTGKYDSAITLDKGHIRVFANKLEKGTTFNTETPNASIELDKYGFVVKYKKEESIE